MTNMIRNFLIALKTEWKAAGEGHYVGWTPGRNWEGK